MKKVLLATTMLVAGASIAAAEVTLSGDARMGVKSDFGTAGLTFDSRARVKFDLSGESDSGLSFGASFRPQDAAAAGSGTAGEVFVKGAFGKLSMGDVDSAAKAAVGNVDQISLTDLGSKNEMTYVGGGGLNADILSNWGPTASGAVTASPTALYEYSAGAFTGYASITKPNFTGTVLATSVEGSAYAVGAKYSVDSYSFALGYENVGVDLAAGGFAADFDHLIASASGTFSGITVKAVYGKGSGSVDLGGGPNDIDLKQYALSATYGADALKATGFISRKTFETNGTVQTRNQAIGFGASYDLGGNASIVGGVARTKNLAGVSDTAYDIGLSFSF